VQELGAGCLRRDVVSLRLAIERKVVGRGFLVYCGAYAFVAARMILVLPIEEFLARWQ